MRRYLEKLHGTRFYRKFHQFFRFCVVGGSNFLVSLAVYNLVLWIYGRLPDGTNSPNAVVSFLFRYDYQIANLLSFLVSVLNAYILNRAWVFRKEAKKAAHGAFFRFFASYGFTYLLSVFDAWFFVEILRVHVGLVPFLNVLVTTPINFFLSKYFSFRKKKIHEEGIELSPYETEEEKPDVDRDA